MLARLSHPNVVKAIGFVENDVRVELVLPFSVLGDLKIALQKCEKISVSEATIVAAELVLALEYIHSKGVTHRDIKPENVVFTEKHHAQLIDFGTATVSNTPMTKFVGSSNYLAPEVCARM